MINCIMLNKMLKHISMKVHLLVFLLAIFLIALHSKAGKPAEPVYDIEGNELSPGTKYYILPSNDRRRQGGGLILSQHNTSWPLFVTHDNSQPGNGHPVTIIPVTNNALAQVQVSVSSNVHIEFASCAVSLESMLWRIGDREGASGRRHVVAGDNIGSGNPEYREDQFRIEINDGTAGGYRIVFCAKVCKLCRLACQNVGVFNEGGKKWLALEGLPITIVFKKSEVS